MKGAKRITIVIGGQIDKQHIADMVGSIGGDRITVKVTGDIQAAMEVKNGTADYYIGACNTGGGGALSMAMALVGHSLCSTLSMPGNIKSNEDIAAEVAAGKKAFGMTGQHIQMVIPVLIENLLEKNGL